MPWEYSLFHLVHGISQSRFANCMLSNVSPVTWTFWLSDLINGMHIYHEPLAFSFTFKQLAKRTVSLHLCLYRPLFLLYQVGSSNKDSNHTLYPFAILFFSIPTHLRDRETLWGLRSHQRTKLGVSSQNTPGESKLFLIFRLWSYSFPPFPLGCFANLSYKEHIFVFTGPNLLKEQFFGYYLQMCKPPSTEEAQC